MLSTGTPPSEVTAPPAATANFVNTFLSSLETKENVDFLLTPAILVKETLGDDVTIVYPSE